MEVWENTLSNFSAQKNQDNMEHTHVKGEKENGAGGGGLKGFIMCLVGAFTVFCKTA